MGYFSSGTEGKMYESQWCQRCVHDEKKSCPILLAHLVYNYDQMRDENADIRKILSMLIPRDGNGENKECTMFVATSDVKEKVDAESEFHKLQHWNAGTPLRG